MDVSGYRSSGELSDITVKVDTEEFHLHKFPLFVRSNYFKNLTSLTSTSDPQAVSKLKLEKFPGGSKTFAIIADYCYNKDVKINGDNVIPVRLAAEYLEMNGNNGSGGGLSKLAENVIVDLLYSAKSKRDYRFVLSLLDKASEHADLAERCDLMKKLIDGFTDNLAVFVKSSFIYDKVYDKSFASYVRLHSLSLNDENMESLNNLPLNWMNELIRASVRNGLNNSLLSYIIQNYINYNTGINPDDSESSKAKAKNLISMATDIIKVDKKLASLANSEEDSKKNNLINMAADILKVDSKLNSLLDESDSKNSLVNIVKEVKEKDEKPGNLINMAADIMKVESKLASLANSDEAPSKDSLVNIVKDVQRSDKEDNEAQDRTKNLISMAGDILHVESKLAQLVETSEDEISSNLEDSISENQSEKDKVNLINITADIFKVDSKLNSLLDESDSKNSLVNIVKEVKEKDEKPGNLINMAADIMKVESKLASLANSDEAPNNDSLVNIVKDVQRSDKADANEIKPKNLINIAGDIIGKDEKKPSNLINVAGEIISADKSKRVKPTPNEQQKLEIIASLANTLTKLKIDPQFPVTWLQTYVKELHRLNGDSDTRVLFHKLLWNALNDPKNNSSDLSEIPSPVMVKILRDAAQDSHDQAKLIDYIDRYISDLENQNKLDVPTFLELASIVPKDKRSSYDSLTNSLLKLFENNSKITSDQQKELLDVIDFTKLNETTLDACKSNKHIPAQNIIDASLALCTRLRKELDEAKLQIRTFEYRSRPLLANNISTNNYTSTYKQPTTYNSYSNKYSSPIVNSRTKQLESSTVNTSSYKTSDLLATDYYTYSNYVPTYSSYSSSTSATSKPASSNYSSKKHINPNCAVHSGLLKNNNSYSNNQSSSLHIDNKKHVSIAEGFQKHEDKSKNKYSSSSSSSTSKYKAHDHDYYQHDIILTRTSNGNLNDYLEDVYHIDIDLDLDDNINDTRIIHEVYTDDLENRDYYEASYHYSKVH